MYLLWLLFSLIVLTKAEFCYNDVEAACSSRPTPVDGPLLANCNAKYGSFEALQADLQAYANAHIETSFEFLLMSAHFGNYEANREGFKHLYRKLSDKSWEDAIDVIKFITKRGGKMNFNQLPRFKKNAKDGRVLELNELNSLAKALDTEKQLAEEALRIHTQAQHHTKQDASVAHYIEEQFFEKQADCVRTLAGHTNDLKDLLGDRDASVSVYLFDDYVKKTL
ncbi:ferritin light chain [Orussus abietinus]|uniref:ferritin light chain n=1 Tax=Orussus abietinus TaxID=222816 RepID=UPI0006253EFD|nr:ferritin light chain [Orussus abietinus]